MQLNIPQVFFPFASLLIRKQFQVIARKSWNIISFGFSCKSPISTTLKKESFILFSLIVIQNVITIDQTRINSCYAYAWDIIMDWGMMQNPTVAIAKTCVPSGGGSDEKTNESCSSVMLRPRLRFGAFLSTLILLSDGFFRFAWVLRFYESSFFASNDAYILFTEILEVFR